MEHAPLRRSVVTGEGEETRRFCWSGAQHIDPNPAPLEIERPVTGEAAHGGLGCAVDAEGRHSDDARRRASQDNRGTIYEQWQRLLHREQHTLHVPAKRIVILLFGDAPKWQV